MPYIIGLDLGQASDYTALCILEVPQTPAPTLAVVHLERFPLQTSYPAIVEQVKGMMASERLCQPRLDNPLVVERAALVIDATGVGAPVFDMFVAAQLPNLIGVHIHGGDSVTHTGFRYRVPKRDLVSCVAVALQERRLQIARALPHAAALEKELLSFKVTIDPATAHDSYAAWREKDHDDLVLAVALACWWVDYQARYRAGTWGRKP